MTTPAVFLSWHDSRRSQSLASRSGLPLVVFVADRTGVSRHSVGALRTAAYLVANLPRLVWFQYSLVLSVVLALYRVLRLRKRMRLVADIHTKALHRDGGRIWRWLVLPLKRWTIRHCDVHIVTNEQNALYASETFGVRPFVLPDPIPIAPCKTHAHGPGMGADKLVVFVCSYAADEPMDLIHDAVEHLGPGYKCVLSGDPSPLDATAFDRLASVAELVGFLPEDEYWRLLAQADSIAVLTTQAACLPCGAYEALSVGRRPVLLEDDVANAVFDGLAIFSVPDGSSLAAAIQTATGTAGHLNEGDVAGFASRWSEAWEQILAATGSGRLSRPPLP